MKDVTQTFASFAVRGFQYCTAVLNTDFRIIFPGSKSQSLLTSSVTLDMELNLPKPQFPYL